MLIVGGQFSGNFSARELEEKFQNHVTDAKELLEIKPAHSKL